MDVLDGYIDGYNLEKQLTDFQRMKDINSWRYFCAKCIEEKKDCDGSGSCVVYHDYDGNETERCYVCDTLLCNHCRRFDGFRGCKKCGNDVCLKCEHQAPLKCNDRVDVLDCKAFICGICYEENEDECDEIMLECNDKTHIE